MFLHHWRSPWIYTFPVIAILLGHFFVDVCSSVIAPLIGVVQTEFSLRPESAAVLLGIGSIFSGLAQPLFAWVSDQTNSRMYGALGILLASMGIGWIGYSSDANMLFVMFSIGMIGIGMFHPIATAKIGVIAGDQRSFAISLFFVFGMAGFFVGSLLGPALVTSSGSLKGLRYLFLPGVVVALLLQLSINRQATGEGAHQARQVATLRLYDWASISLLYISAVFRFFVQMAMVYLIVRWVEAYVSRIHPEWTIKDVARTAAPLAGYANAAMFLGQGMGGLLAGVLIRTGREKAPLIWTPILCAPCLMLLAFIQPGWFGYAACFLGGAGFAAMTPITISVGQRMMPGHTRLASGLLLGGAWVFASLGPRSAEFLIDQFELPSAIVTTGFVLMLAGAVVWGINNEAVTRNTVATDMADMKP